MDRQINFDITPFKKLMNRRIKEILLVCSDYDIFMLEEDGRIEEELFEEYSSLGLTSAPKIVQTSSGDKAFELLKEREFDLVITMLNLGETGVGDLAEDIRRFYPDQPMVVLSPMIPTEVTMQRLNMATSEHFLESNINHFFTWQGNSNLLLAMVKLLEDEMNAPYDVEEFGVQAIILVEDSVRYYSMYLPIIYRVLIKQAQSLMKEGLTKWEQVLRLRSRPKILLARSYEEAVALYDRYKHNVLGVISDISYFRQGSRDEYAGIALAKYIRKDNQELPILLQSSNIDHRDEVTNLGLAFAYKRSKRLFKELADFMEYNFGFGPFLFRNPHTGEVVADAPTLRDLQHTLRTINSDSFRYHVTNHDISRWLKARGLFSLAKYIRNTGLDRTPDEEDLRKLLVESIRQYRIQESRGRIAHFTRAHFDEALTFSRIGYGSLGGKGRGLAFIDNQLSTNTIHRSFPQIEIGIPKTVVITTDRFDHFIQSNQIEIDQLEHLTDGEILEQFLHGQLLEDLVEDMRHFLNMVEGPLAVRSSSLLEDSHMQPFAGIYDTKMIPNNQDSIEERLESLLHAIKAVYASTYFKESREYLVSTNHMPEEEKMAVIIQRITAKEYGDIAYPAISGVARSINYYPLEGESPEDGIAYIAFGFGKTIVEGERGLRFSPGNPKRALQLTDIQEALRTNQKEFYALDMGAFESRDTSESKGAFESTESTSENGDVPHTIIPDNHQDGALLALPLSKAPMDLALGCAVSTFDAYSGQLRDGVNPKGERIVTFAGILKHDMFPLAEILKKALTFGRDRMNTHVEIEFSVLLDPKEMAFNFLQLRPIMGEENRGPINLPKEIATDKLIIQSQRAMGNGTYTTRHLILVSPTSFDPAKTQSMAESIEKINETFQEQFAGEEYILVAPGRLGSRDPWLGVPCTWGQIHRASLFVELQYKDFHIEASQGTHFFQNLTSMRRGYMTVDMDLSTECFREKNLPKAKVLYKDTYIKHLHFSKPITAYIDGRTREGVITQ